MINNSLSDPFSNEAPALTDGPSNCFPCNIHRVCKAHAQARAPLTLISSRIKGGGPAATQEHGQKSLKPKHEGKIMK